MFTKCRKQIHERYSTNLEAKLSFKYVNMHSYTCMCVRTHVTYIYIYAYITDVKNVKKLLTNSNSETCHYHKCVFVPYFSLKILSYFINGHLKTVETWICEIEGLFKYVKSTKPWSLLDIF